jgi:hypothetical protein
MNREDSRLQRVADNQRLIRETNRELEQEAADWTHGAPASDLVQYEVEFLCACGRPDCHETVLLTIGEYQRAHSRPHRFVVTHGHANPRLERVVERHGGYDVVEKLPQYRN